MASPAQQVFGTYELLEQILLYSATLTILRASAITRRTRAIIADSTKLQQKLFLLPIGPLDTAPRLTNTLLNTPLHKSAAYQTITDKSPDYACASSYQPTFYGKDLCELGQTPTEGSHLDMFLTQPPTTAVSVQLLSTSHTSRPEGYLGTTWWRCFSADGVRLRDIYHFVENCPGPDLFSQYA